MARPDPSQGGFAGFAPLRGGGGVGVAAAPASPFSRLTWRGRGGNAGRAQPLPRELDQAYLQSLGELMRILLLWQKTGVLEIEFAFLRYDQNARQMGGGRFWPDLRDSQGKTWPARYSLSQLGSIQGAYYRALAFQGITPANRKPASLYMQPLDPDRGQTHPWLFIDDVRRAHLNSTAALGRSFQILIETSENNFQGWMLADRIPASKHERSALQGDLARRLAADKNAGGYLRLARAPGSINWKLGRGAFRSCLHLCDSRSLVAKIAESLPPSSESAPPDCPLSTRNDWLPQILQFEGAHSWARDWKSIDYIVADIMRGQHGDYSEDDWRECRRLIFVKRLRPFLVLQALAIASFMREKHSAEDYAARTIFNLIQRFGGAQ